MTIRYVGNGPYCYANTLSMVFGDEGPGPAAVEVLSGSAYGFTLMGDEFPFFSAAGWSPEIGIRAVLDLLGWTCETVSGTAEEGVAELAKGTRTKPVLAGPFEMGLLPHIPGMGVAVGADHFLIVFGVENGEIRAHDPQGYAFITIPVERLLPAWNTETLVYGVPSYQSRKNFVKEREVALNDALRASLPAAAKWLEGGESGAKALRLAEIIEEGPNYIQHKYLTEFSISCGARRLADAAALLADVAPGAAKVLDTQANLVGSLQHPVLVADNAKAAAAVRELAPTYDELHTALVQEI